MSMSTRDIQVLHLVTKGQTAKAIAGELGITQRTVEYHFERAKREMCAHSMAEAVFRWAKMRKVPRRHAPTNMISWLGDI